MTSGVCEKFGGVPANGPCRFSYCSAQGSRRRHWRMGRGAYIELCDDHAKYVAWRWWVWSIIRRKLLSWRTLSFVLLLLCIVEGVLLVRRVWWV